MGFESISTSKLQDSFAAQFEALTGHRPFPWQESLFSVMHSRSPLQIRTISLPTGAGKTSIMPIWLLALAGQAAREEDPRNIHIPRRLVWVVNRRTVVDQATHEAELLATRLRETNSVESLNLVREGLKKICLKESNEDLLAISTLRGQFADNATWRTDPSTPAIVIGTVDMIGSRLLFSGYGCGYKSKPLHAGFLGQDSLLVHDEAHLEPAFQKLIDAIESEQRRSADFRPLKVVALTAMSRDDGDKPFALTEVDRKHNELRKRIEAGKGVAFSAVDDEKQIADKIFERGLEFKDSGQAILIFLRKLEDVIKVREKLKTTSHVQTLTGTLRGLERDALVTEDKVFARFLPNPSVEPQEGTVFLLCTSAGEVGIDISANHLICDLTPFDSMAQRFGRVNRYGKGDGRVDIVYSTSVGQEPKKNENPGFQQACQQTLALLQKLPRRTDELNDGSPSALGALLHTLTLTEREAAFTPQPIILPTTDILFDVWALTSVRDKLPGRPPVADWLHGVSEWEPPETYVAWREEVEVITPDLREIYNPQNLLEDYPLKPHELLRDTAGRVFKSLETIAARAANARTAGHPELSVWLVEPDGQVRVRTLAEFVTETRESGVDSLANCSVLLPPSAGGLEKGMLSGNAKFDEARHYDVADQWLDEKNVRRRRRVWDDDPIPQGMRLLRTIDTHADAEEDDERSGSRRCWLWCILPKSADDDGSRAAQSLQKLQPHLEEAERFATALAAKLLPDPDLAEAVAMAAKWHDLGKDRSMWQRSIGNFDPNVVLAKSGNKMRPIEPTRYRHELGSLLDLAADAEFIGLEQEMQDLVLHFIACHHGRARPHFPAEEIFDPEHLEKSCVKAALEVPRRYARLQRKYGRWGLAYVESLVRAADVLASQNAEEALAVGGVAQ